MAYSFLKDGADSAAITYGELERKVRTIAARLAGTTRPGDRALLLYPPGSDFLAAFLGCLYARVVPAPLPVPGARAGLEKIALVARDTSARVVLTVSGLVDDMRAGLASVPVEATDAIDDATDDPLDAPAIDPGSLAYLQYTSGSTSVPRGVMVSHANVLHNLANIDQGFRHGPDSVIVTWLPHFHDMGLIYGLLAPLYHQIPCHVLSPAVFVQRPLAWLEAITRLKATHSGGPNFAYDLCVRRIAPEARAELDLSSWQVAFNGAESVHAETLDRFTEAFTPHGFRRTAFYPAYGLAEASLKVSGGVSGDPPVVFAANAAALALNRAEPAQHDGADARLIVGCGQPGLDTRVAIVDPEQRIECPAGQVGEVWVAGPGVTLGYWNREEETRETFGARIDGTGDGPFLRTGDLGFLLANELFIAGRLKDLVIIRGLNHHPSDIELTARRAHPQLAWSVGAAFSIDVADEERLVIVLEAGRQAPPEPEEIAAAVRREVAEKHQAQTYSLVLLRKGGIPKTSSGKIQRGRCRSLYLARKLDVLYESIMDETAAGEEALPLDREALHASAPDDRRRIVTGYLRYRLAVLLKQKASAIDPSQPLTSYGIDSLIAMELQNRVEQDLGVMIDAVELIGGASVEDLVARIVQQLSHPVAEAPIPRHGGSRAPLSFEQERLWLLNQIVPGNPAHHIPFAVRMTGPLHYSALEGSLDEVVSRHDSLRCSFATEAGVPVCAPVELREMRIPVEQVADLADALERAAQETARPFRLEEAPLFRFRLYRLGPEDHVAFLLIHHIIADLWSARLFIEELLSLYTAKLENSEAALEPPPIQYSDFAAWQRGDLREAKLERLVNYWKQRLQGAKGLEIPPDKARPKPATFQGGSETFTIPAGQVDLLRTFCQRERVTPFVALLAAFEVLLARVSGETDIVLGVTSANRARPELERLIGFFAAPLVLRTQIAEEIEFREALQRVRQEVLGASSHHELPFAKVVEAAQAERQASYTPLVRVMFSLFRSLMPEARAPELTLAPLDIDPGATDFDLFVNLIENGRELRGLAVYNSGIFQPETICTLIAAFLDVLQTAIAEPQTRVSEFRVPESLARASRAPRPDGERSTIVVTATFTAEPVEEILRFWMAELDFDYRVRFAPYNQVFQQLLEPASLAGGNHKGLNTVLVRLEDWARGRTAADLGELEDAVERFIAALESAAASSPSPFLVCLCPASPDFLATDERETFQKRMEDLIAASFAQVSTVHVVRPADIASLYPVSSYYDAHGDRLGHVPYTPDFYAALGTMIARKIHAMRTAPFKVISLDCDQTLWSGICGEDGPSGVTIDQPRRALQEFVIEQHRAGMLLCLATKNNEDDVWATFEAQSEMPLRKEHLVAARIDWKPKSKNLRSMAAELELSLDSFIHIDDSPTECAEIEANCPEVLALELPKDPQRIPQYLQHVWAFDHLTTTEEDKKRTAMYGQRLERRKLQHQAATLDEFLAALKLEVRIEEASPEQLARVSQLTQRTNQMNFTTIRRSEHQIREMLRSGNAECLVVDLSDRFGDYGIVGVIIFTTDDNELFADSFLVSCRALGRGVEHRMVAKLGEIAHSRGLGSVVLRYQRTAKNRPAADFVEAIGAGWEDGPLYRLPTAYAASLAYSPNSKPGEAVASEQPLAAPEKTRRTIDYHRIATELDDAGKILERVRATLHAGVVTTTPYQAPRTPLEKELAAIWVEMLHVLQVGVEDNFFDLGGHSLLAVQLLSRVRDVYNVDLPLDVVFTGNFCVAELAKAVEIFEIEQAGAEEYSELMKELEGLSDDEVRALLEQELQDDATRTGDSS